MVERNELIKTFNEAAEKATEHDGWYILFTEINLILTFPLTYQEISENVKDLWPCLSDKFHEKWNTNQAYSKGGSVTVTEDLVKTEDPVEIVSEEEFLSKAILSRLEELIRENEAFAIENARLQAKLEHYEEMFGAALEDMEG